MTKAISALIATVILVAITISMSAIIFSFSSGLLEYQTSAASAQIACSQRGSLYIYSAMCTRVRDSSLVGYWKLDSVNASNYTLDSSGYRNDGRLFNGTANCFNATGCINLTAGMIGNALRFDGVDDYVDAGNAASLDITTGDFSISVWMKGTLSFITKTGAISGTPGWALRANTDGTFSISLNDGVIATYNIGSASVTTNWRHVTTTFQRNENVTVYVNGIFLGAANISARSGSLSTSQPVRIGKYLGGTPSYFNGSIDEVRVYNRSLSAAEIAAHYAAGLEKFAVDGYFKTIKAAVMNIGTTPLSNFTVFADINGRLYLNSTPENGGVTLPGASEPLTLQANTYYDGPIKTLKVSVQNCPISMTMTNDSGVVGIC